MSALRALADLLFPPVCRLCRVPAEFPLCAACRARFHLIRPPFCRKCGRPVEGAVAVPASCGECRGRGLGFTSARGAAAYAGTFRDAIHELKFRGCAAMAVPIGELMASAWRAFGVPVDAVVPVPLHPARLRERGFNQAGLLARTVGRELGIPQIDVLVRVRSAQRQSALHREERRRNVRETFAARDQVGGKRIVLIDDVLSTGFTASECSARLYEAGARDVHVLVAALAVLDGRTAAR